MGAGQHSPSAAVGAAEPEYRGTAGSVQPAASGKIRYHLPPFSAGKSSLFSVSAAANLPQRHLRAAHEPAGNRRFPVHQPKRPVPPTGTIAGGGRHRFSQEPIHSAFPRRISFVEKHKSLLSKSILIYNIFQGKYVAAATKLEKISPLLPVFKGTASRSHTKKHRIFCKNPVLFRTRAAISSGELPSSFLRGKWSSVFFPTAQPFLI